MLHDVLLALRGTPNPVVAQHTTQSVACNLTSYHDFAWEDDSSLEWGLSLVTPTVSVEGFVSIAAETAPLGLHSQDTQLVTVLPQGKFDLEGDAAVGVAKAVIWWLPGDPVYCKFVNRTNDRVAVRTNRPGARMIALNVGDAARFRSLFDPDPSTVDLPMPMPVPATQAIAPLTPGAVAAIPISACHRRQSRAVGASRET